MPHAVRVDFQNQTLPPADTDSSSEDSDMDEAVSDPAEPKEVDDNEETPEPS